MATKVFKDNGYIEYTFDGDHTIKDALDYLYTNANLNLISSNSYIEMTDFYYRLVKNRIGSNTMYSNTEVNENTITIRTFDMRSNDDGSNYYYTSKNNDGTLSITNSSSAKMPNGVVIRLYY